MAKRGESAGLAPKEPLKANEHAHVKLKPGYMAHASHGTYSTLTYLDKPWPLFGGLKSNPIQYNCINKCIL